MYRSVFHIVMMFPTMVLLTFSGIPSAYAAEVYRCKSQNGEQVFQGHPCDTARPAVKADPVTTSPATVQEAQRNCEDWSQLGYLAAVARDSKQPQQQLLERYGQDGLDDGERAAIEWAYREFRTSPTEIKRAIRADCLHERLNEKPKKIFGDQSGKQPGEFSLGERRYRFTTNPPWTLDNTRSGKRDAAVYLFANGADSGRMSVHCVESSSRMSQQDMQQQIFATAFSSGDTRGVSEPKADFLRFADGLLGSYALPLPGHQGKGELALKQPRHIVHGILDKDAMRCTFRIETFLPEGPAQQAGLRSMHSVFDITDQVQ